jgi:drug/metabolite transporter (DMT)-like permease
MAILTSLDKGGFNEGYVFGITAALIWAGFILVSRMGGVSELLAYDIIAIRYMTCAIILLPLWWLKFRFNLFTPRLIICSLIGGLAYALCAFSGFQMAPASHAAILLPGMMPFFIIVLSYIINKEQYEFQKWLGAGVITLGVIVLFTSTFSLGTGILKGDAYFIAAAFFWGLFSILIKRWGITPLQVTISLALLTCMFYMPVYLVALPKEIFNASWTDILLQAFYQGVMATIVQMIFYVKAVQKLGPSEVGTVMSIVPVISGISGIYIFNELLSKELVAGLLLVSLGAFFAQSKFFKYKKTVV